MESEVVALEKVQESQESPARNPSLHLSQDMRLTQSQDMLDTVRLAEMLTSFSNLSQGDHPNSSLPFFRSDSYQFRSQELSANLTPEKNRLASMGSVERSDSLYLGLIQHLGLSLSQQSQVPVEATDELIRTQELVLSQEAPQEIAPKKEAKIPIKKPLRSTIVELLPNMKGISNIRIKRLHRKRRDNMTLILRL
ncbi:hypothetical protein WA588_005574 [Blastocystis sp. NMH]